MPFSPENERDFQPRLPSTTKQYGNDYDIIPFQQESPFRALFPRRSKPKTGNAKTLTSPINKASQSDNMVHCFLS